MDDAAIPSPDPDPQAAPAPTAAAPAPAAQKAPFLAMTWSRRSRVLAGIAALAIATTGGVAIAATSEPSPEPSAEAAATPASPREQKELLEKRMQQKGGLAKGHVMKGHVMKGMGGAFGLGSGGVLHGEFVTPNGEDGFTTHVMQTGTVASVGGSSLEVKSEDGHTRSYVLNGDTVVNGARGWTADAKGGVATGQTVTVMATKSGDTATAKVIHARDAKMADDEPMMPGDAKMKMKMFRDGPDRMMMRGGPGGMKRFEMAPGDERAIEKKMMLEKQMMEERMGGEEPTEDVVEPAPSSAS